LTTISAGPLDPGGPVLLVGAGKLGGALLDGWLDGGLDPRLAYVLDPGLSEPAAERLSALGVTLQPQAPDLSNAVAIVVAVKPQMAASVLPAVATYAGPSSVVISVMAGQTLEVIGAALPQGAAVVRAMPNTPASVGRGITGCFAGSGVSATQKALVDRLLRAVGDVVWVDDEDLIDAVTGVSGSGPAYVFLLVEALAKAGVAAGLPADVAETLARKTVEGAGELLVRSPEPPATLRRNVTSPNGTTAAALDVLMAEDGLEALMERAVAAATKRAKELARPG
jgi:pyrroline-5-carboxylate reductase